MQLLGYIYITSLRALRTTTVQVPVFYAQNSKSNEIFIFMQFGAFWHSKPVCEKCVSKTVFSAPKFHEIASNNL